MNTDPTQGAEKFKLVGSAAWVPTGGVNGSGWLKLTDGNGQSAAILFPDFDNGLVVKAFTFEAMVKLGEWTSVSPADGFSINYARANDPIIGIIAGGENPGRGGRTDGWAGSFDNGGNEENLPEEGTKTGLGIGFDTWGTGDPPVGGSNGPNDVRGISVRVDGTQLTQISMPAVVFPAGSDGTADFDYAKECKTLITGPRTGVTDSTDPDFGKKLQWVPLKMTIDENGVLNVFWKGCQIVTNLQTAYFPSAGRIVVGASTGGANELAGIDDVKITTVPADKAVIGTAVGNPAGFTMSISDSGASKIDTKSISLKLDSVAITTATINKDTNGITTIKFSTLPNFFDAGSQHAVDVSAKDALGNTISGTRKFTVPNFFTMPDSLALTNVDKSKTGFLVRTWQVDMDQPNSNERSERELAGELGPNIADVSMFTDNGYLDEKGVINYWDNGGQGNFPNDTPNIPGISNGTGGVNNFAMEILAAIEFPAPGEYKMGVNSDDGFRIYTGTNLMDRFFVSKNKILGEFNGGRGAGDTVFSFVVKKPAVFPFRMTFEQGGGGTEVEWFMVQPDGTKVLINDSATAGALKAFRYIQPKTESFNNSFNIEAEDFDFDSGKTVDAASTMPYTGGAYADKGAKLGVDYNNDDSQDSTAYRNVGDLAVKGKGVNITDNLGGQYGNVRPGATEGKTFTVTTNFRIGWVNDTDWNDFTRTIPAGVYTAYAALSFDGRDPHQLRGHLGMVTAGAGTSSQTVQPLGDFDAPGSGGWGRNDIVPLLAADGSPGAFKLPGGKVTLRFTMSSGDFDWFTLVSASSPPKVTSASPATGSTVPRTATLNFTITDLTTTVNVSSIKLMLDNADVTSKATITKTATGATVQLVPSPILTAGSHTAVLTFSDSASPAVSQTFTTTFSVNVLGTPGEFLVEAEDFDFGSGQTKPEASTMPYTGGAYKGLSAAFGVDYKNNDNQDSTDYRNGGDLATKGKGANINGNDGDRDRGGFSVTSNFKIGWVDAGDWQNYTRTIPNGNYQVWAAQSYDDLNTPHRLQSKLDLVTAGVGTTNQTTQTLGIFDAPGTAGWGVNRLVPMTDTNGAPVTVALGGKQTLKWEITSGDADFFMLIPSGPVTPPGPKITSITISSGKITIQWSGNAKLQSAEKVTGPFTDVANATSPFTASPTGKAKFFRLLQP